MDTNQFNKSAKKNVVGEDYSRKSLGVGWLVTFLQAFWLHIESKLS